MLLHKKCHGHVLIPIEGLRIAVDSFGISAREKNLTINQVTILDEKPGRKTASISFYCTNCGKENIDIDEINMHCGNCEVEVPLKDLFTIQNNGGIYCTVCKKKIVERNGISEESFVNILPFFTKKIQL